MMNIAFLQSPFFSNPPFLNNVTIRIGHFFCPTFCYDQREL